MTTPQAQWLRYGAYSLVIVLVALGAYYFLYVDRHAEQLENDRLAMLRESSGYFTEEIVRLKENVDNTLTEDRLSNVRGEQKDSLLASKLKQIEGVVGTPVDAARTEHWGNDCADQLGKNDPPPIYAQFEPAAPHPKLHFEFVDDGSCRVATVTPHSLLRPLLPQKQTSFDQLMLVRKDGTVLLPGDGESLSIPKLPLHNHDSNPSAGENGKTTDGLYTDIFTLDAAGTSFRVFMQPFQIPLPVTYETNTTDIFEGSLGGKQEILYLTGVKKEAAFQAEARQLPPIIGFGLLGLLGLSLLAFPFLEVWLISPTEPFTAYDILQVAVGVVIVASAVTLALLSGLFYERFLEWRSAHLVEQSEQITTTLKKEANKASARLKNLTHDLKRCVKKGDANCVRSRNILEGSAPLFGTHPDLEMASWINKEGKQVAKWSVEEQTTPLIDVSDREYVRAHAAQVGSPLPMPDRDKVWRYTNGDSTKWVLQSIRSKNTGEVLAQISQRMEQVKVAGASRDDTTAVIAAATLPLLSLIDPVLPRGHGFALINDDGQVLFHDDTRRNLRENIYEKIGKSGPLREAVRARRATTLRTQYREDPHQVYTRPLENSPWTVLVFSDYEPIRVLRGQILTYAISFFLSGLLILFLLVIIPWMAVSDNMDFGLAGLYRALWPTPQKTALYWQLLQWEGSLLVVGLVLVALLALHILPLLVMGGLFLLCGCAIGMLFYYNGRSAPDENAARVFNWPKAYVGSILLVTLLLGVLLPAGVYCHLHNEGTKLLTKKNQKVLAERMIERGDRIVEKYRKIPLWEASTGMLQNNHLPSNAWEEKIPLKSTLTVRTSNDSNVDTSVTDRTLKNEREATQKVYGLLGSIAPTPWDRHLYMLSSSASSADRWMWDTNENSTLVLSAEYQYLTLDPDAGPTEERVGESNLNLEIQSAVPTVTTLLPGNGQLLAIGLIAVALLIVGLWYAIQYLTRKIYFLRCISTVESEKTQGIATYVSSSPPRSLFIRSHRGSDGEEEESIHYIDSAVLSQDPAPKELAQEARTTTADVVIVNNVHDGLEEPEIAQAKLALLEELAGLDKAIELYSEVDPLSVLKTSKTTAQEEAPTAGEAAASSPSESPAEPPPDPPPEPAADIPLNEWAVVLRDYRRHWAPSPQDDPTAPALETLQSTIAPNATDQTTQNLECLARECRPDAYLRDEVAPFLADTLNLEALDGEQVIEQVKYQAEAHYHTLWATCSDAEKVVLYRLSTDGFASPNSQQIVEELLRRGLLVMDPDLRPMNESFRRFVETLHSPVVAKYNRQSRHESWRRVQTPLLLGLTAVLVFIFVTQPNLAQEAAALLPTLAAGLPALLKIVSALFVGQSAMGFTS